MTSRRFFGPLLTLLLTLLLGGCAVGRMVGGSLAYANPSRLVGTWLDSAAATPTDTIAWVLGPRGLDQTLTVHIQPDSAGAPARSEHVEGYGYWYVPGTTPEADSGRICFRGRGRGRDACFAYQLSAAYGQSAGNARPPRRRLLIVAYQGRKHTRDRVLVER